MTKRSLGAILLIALALGAAVFFYRGGEVELQPIAEKSGLIRVDQPRPNDIIRSPLAVTGEARGTWYFEASFPVRLYDEKGREIALGIAQAQSEWMTTQFVPFRAELTFEPPAAAQGTLVLEKDNPSGLPEHADELRIPVRFR